MKKRRQKKVQKLNNAGMTLIEVLIAITILCIVSIPLMKAFVTAAKTNGKAKILFKATNAAENVMELFKTQSLEELKVKYASSYAGSEVTGISGDTVTQHSFTIKDDSLSNEYNIVVTLDPQYYPNNNSANLGQFKTVSSADSAVYAMPLGYDRLMYEHFVKANEDARTAGMLIQQKDLSYFQKNTERNITIEVIKDGSGKDDTGEMVDLVSVTMVVTYTVKASDVDYALPPADQTITLTRQLFNNKDTRIPLSSVFILYNPIYYTTINDADNIFIKNDDNVAFDLFVVAQINENTTTDPVIKSNYLTGNGLDLNNRLNLTIEENPLTPVTTGYRGAITLRTNLHGGLPADSSELKEVSCNLAYQNMSGVKETKEASMKYVNTHSAEGKVLDGSGSADRIYNITVKVLDGANEQIVYLEGTKLE